MDENFSSKLDFSKIIVSSKPYDFVLNEKKWSKDNFTNEIADYKLKELKWRVSARKNYGRGLMLLLFVQNIFIGILVWGAYTRDSLGGLSVVLSTLIAGTLTETAYIVRIIVKELFKDISYKDYNNKRH